MAAYFFQQLSILFFHLHFSYLLFHFVFPALYSKQLVLVLHKVWALGSSNYNQNLSIRIGQWLRNKISRFYFRDFTRFYFHACIQGYKRVLISILFLYTFFLSDYVYHPAEMDVVHLVSSPPHMKARVYVLQDVL